MKILPLTREKYQEWDEFCRKSDEAWFWHTSEWIEYVLNYKPDLGPKNMSFFVTDGQKIVAICPLILQSMDGNSEFYYGADYGQVPAFLNELSTRENTKIMKLVFNHLDELSKAENVIRLSMRFPSLDKAFLEDKKNNFNYLTKFNFLDSSIAAQIIDLRKIESELWGDFTHGLRETINKGMQCYKINIFDNNNITETKFREYQELHKIDAGRVTRQQKTFDLMLDFIKKGYAVLAEAEKDGVSTSFAYIYIYKKSAYYGSSCKAKHNEIVPSGHLLQWHIIQWLKNHGYFFYEIGGQRYGNTLFNFPDKKELGISTFKRSFGWFTVPLFWGEKYYDKDFFLKTYGERIRRYAEFM